MPRAVSVSLNRLSEVDREKIDERYNEIYKFTHFEQNSTKGSACQNEDINYKNWI